MVRAQVSSNKIFYNIKQCKILLLFEVSITELTYSLGFCCFLNLTSKNFLIALKKNICNLKIFIKKLILVSIKQVYHNITIKYV